MLTGVFWRSSSTGRALGRGGAGGARVGREPARAAGRVPGGRVDAGRGVHGRLRAPATHLQRRRQPHLRVHHHQRCHTVDTVSPHSRTLPPRPCTRTSALLG